MGDCHECNCFVDPPCGACERCKHWFVDEWPNVNRAVFSLRLGIEEQEREASRAKEQAELEAEALELYNARISFLGGEALTSFEKLNQDNKDMWLAVARKAREMRTEK